MIGAAHTALAVRGLATVVAAPDETSSLLFIKDWEGYPEETRGLIGQINVHSYGNSDQTAVRDIARGADIRLWMSENDTPAPGDPEDFTSITTPLAFAEHVVGDLKRLEPSAWVFWQAVESFSALDGRKGANWGLVKADLRSGPVAEHGITITKKYWSMMQFSRHIRPGDRLLRVADPDTIGALSPDGKRMVLVHVNTGQVTRNLAVPGEWNGTRCMTDATHNHVCDEGTNSPPRSIVTLILSRIKN